MSEALNPPVTDETLDTRCAVYGEPTLVYVRLDNPGGERLPLCAPCAVAPHEMGFLDAGVLRSSTLPALTKALAEH